MQPFAVEQKVGKRGFTEAKNSGRRLAHRNVVRFFSRLWKRSKTGVIEIKSPDRFFLQLAHRCL